MALFKPYKILSNKLSSLPVKEGQLIVTTDTGDIYVDLSNSERKQLAVTDLSDYVTSSVLISSIAAEAQEREKQDNLLEDVIEGKLDVADLVEGNNITISADGSGHVTIAASVPDISDFITETEADAAYAAKSHTHSVATDSANGFMSAADKEKLDTIQEGANKTTVDSALSSTSTNPVQNKVINTALAGKANTSHNHSAANITSGVLDAARIPTITNSKIESVAATKLTGTIPQANLPSYVDDVLEYNGVSNFPDTGETGKIYVDTTTNKTYRWGGSSYVEISASLALGTTSSTAFRGDYGNTAYQHATAKGSAFSNGLYKITTNAQGHVTAATAVTKSDITALGIPAQDTNTIYGVATDETNGLMSAADKEKLDGIAAGANKYTLPTASSSILGGVKTGANITNSSGTISLTKANVTAALGYTPPTADTNTWVAFKGATTTAAGTAGYVPAPTAGAANRYFRSDGTWTVPPNTNTTYTLTKSGSTITLNGSDGSETSVTDSNTTYSLSSFGITATAAELNKLDGLATTKTELGYLDGVTSNVQTQLNGKAASSHSHSNMTGATTSAAGKAGFVPAPAAGSATRYLRSDGTWQVPPNTTYTLSSFGITATAAEINKLDGLLTTKTELGYLDGVTSNVQTQLNGKAASSHNHSAANITSGTLAVARGGTGITANPSMLVNLGSTSAASVFATSPRPGITGTLAVSHGGTGATSAASARSNLGAAASDIIVVSSSQPSSSTCKLWIKP